MSTQPRSHLHGLILAIVGVLVLTPDSLLVRLIATDPWTLLFWRGLGVASGLSVVFLARYKRRWRAEMIAIGWRLVPSAMVIALGSIFFILSLSATSVANTLLLISTAPLFAALIGSFFLAERTNRATWIAIVIGFSGIIVIVFDGLSTLGFDAVPWGEVFALCTALTLALQFSLVRAARDVDMTPSVIAGSLLFSGLGLIIAQDVSLPTNSLLMVGVLSLIILPISFICLTYAPRYLPAPEVSLILLLETVIAPFWVWAVLAETPATASLLGGAVILAALIGHSIYAWHRRR